MELNKMDMSGLFEASTSKCSDKVYIHPQGHNLGCPSNICGLSTWMLQELMLVFHQNSYKIAHPIGISKKSKIPISLIKIRPYEFSIGIIPSKIPMFLQSSKWGQVFICSHFHTILDDSSPWTFLLWRDFD